MQQRFTFLAKTLNKNHQTLEGMLSTSRSLRKMKTDMLSIVHLYTRYILRIGWLYATYHQFREPGNSIDIHTSSLAKGKCLNGTRRHPGNINSGNPHDQRRATGEQPPGQHSQGWRQYWSHPCGLVASAGGWKGLVNVRQSSFVIQLTNRFRRDIGHVTKKLSERKS